MSAPPRKVAVRPRAATVAIDVATPCARWQRSLPDAERCASTAARAALKGAGRAFRSRQAELSLVLADDRLVRRLNRAWRGRDRATNVLSFAADAHAVRGAPVLLGDVVLAFETVRREAAEQGKALSDHLSHLVAHGVLHLVGFDHEDDAEAERMENLERRILAGLGIADPYRAEGRSHG